MALSLGEWVAHRGARTPEKIALIDAATEEQTSYAELERRVRARAAGLRERGVCRGDRVALLGLNSVAYFETIFAVAWIGAITAPINFRLAPAEVGFILDDTSASVLVHDETFADLARGGLEAAERATPELVAIADLAVDGGAAKAERGISPDDVAMLMYTSGTTGRPKGAMITHGNLEWNAINMLTAGEGMIPSDVTVAAAPLFHIGGLSLFTLPLLYAGGTIVVVGAFDPRQTLELLAKHKATIHFMVPAMWAAMMQVPDFDDFDLSRLRYPLSGGAPCPIPVIEFYQGKGLPFVEGFGMTELAPASLVLEAAFVRTHAGSVGRPFLHVDVRIVDNDDKDVPVGEVGELLCRGPNVCSGYWGLPDATDEAMRGGWFHSGDMARQDEDGFVTLVDRKKDMIISGGENIYPVEVEQVLYRHPQVEDVAVIGVPDERWGETVMAVIVPVAGETIDKDEVIAYCRERIAAYKCPRLVETIEVLPRNVTGKLLKRELRSSYAGTDSSVTR